MNFTPSSFQSCRFMTFVAKKKDATLEQIERIRRFQSRSTKRRERALRLPFLEYHNPP